MIAYKFLRSTDTHFLMNGSFKFGSINFYQMLEYVYDDQWIGDKNEGISVNVINDLSVLPEQNEEINSKNAKTLEMLGLAENVALGATVSFQHISFISQKHAYIMSLSVGDFSGLANAMANPPEGQEPYDACIEISDVEAFANCLYECGTIGGTRLTSILPPPQKGNVTYESNSGDLLTSPVESSIFRKSPSYRNQSEYRIAFLLNDMPDNDAIYICCPDATKYLSHKTMPTARNSFTQKTAKADSVQDSLAALSRIVALYHDSIRWRQVAGPFGQYDYHASQKDLETRMAQFECQMSGPIGAQLVRAYWTLRCSNRALYFDDAIEKDIRRPPLRSSTMNHLMFYLNRLQGFSIVRQMSDN